MNLELLSSESCNLWFQFNFHETIVLVPLIEAPSLLFSKTKLPNNAMTQIFAIFSYQQWIYYCFFSSTAGNIWATSGIQWYSLVQIILLVSRHYHAGHVGTCRTSRWPVFFSLPFHCCNSRKFQLQPCSQKLCLYLELTSYFKLFHL